MVRTARLVPVLVPGALMLGSLVALAPSAVAAPAVSPAVSPAAAPSAMATEVDPTNRESMRQGYLDILEPALQTPIGWTGNIAGCNAGAPSPAAQEATLTAVNYFRGLVGVEPVTFDAALSAKAQKAALMMAANGTLSHDPPTSWRCHTADGAEAAGKSNLALGNAGASAVAAYMRDGGTGNEAAGHRRWIIDPQQTTMGSGSVQGSGWQSTSNALYVLDSGSFQATPPATPEFMPWPVAGYHPVQIEPGGRWSLSAKGGISFAGASVKINGSSAGITLHPVANGYGPNTLVWNFDPAFAPGDADRTYRVVVSGITGASTSSYAYDVTLFDAEAPSDTTPPEIGASGKAFRVALDGFGFSWLYDRSDVDAIQQRVGTRTPGSSGGWSTGDWEAPAESLWEAQPEGQTLCLSGRARDATGNVSGWTAPSCIHTPVDDLSVKSSRGWKTMTSTGLWHGSALKTTKSGAKVTVPGAVGIDRVGIVMTRCANCGKVAIRVGRTKVGVVDMKGSPKKTQVVKVLPRLETPLDGPVKVVVVSSGKTVQIDGVVVSGPPAD